MSSKFKDFRESLIKQFICYEQFDSALFPSLDAICALAISRFLYRDAGLSAVDHRHLIDTDLRASASGFNTLGTEAAIDLNTMQQFARFLAANLESRKVEILNSLSSLSFIAQQLELNSRGMLLSTNVATSDGQVFVDSLVTDKYIDPAETTAYFDAESGIVLGSKPESIETVSLSEATVNVIGIGTYSTSATTSPFSDMWAVLPKPWTFNLATSSASSLGMEAQAYLTFPSARAFNTISLTFPNLTYDIAIFTVMAGVSSQILPYTTYTGAATISIPATTATSLILRLRTTVSTSRGSMTGYLFSLDKIEITYNLKASYPTQMITRQLQFPNEFSRVSLYTEEILDDELAGISYEIQGYDNDGAALPWVAISNPTVNKDIHQDNFVEVVPGADIEFSQEKIDLATYSAYNSGANKMITMNSPFPFLEMIPSSCVVLRDVASNPGAPILNISSTYYIYCKEDIVADFSTFTCTVDGGNKSSKFTLARGAHKLYSADFNGLFSFTTALYAANPTTLKVGLTNCKYVSPGDFINTIEDYTYDKFTVIKDASSNAKFYVKSSDDMVFTTAIPQFEVGVAPGKAHDTAKFTKTIRLRATFKSTGSSIPRLDSYKIKVQ